MVIKQKEKKILSRREIAYKFIKENSGKIIKADIIRYMDENGSSLRTTHHIIQDFLVERKITFELDSTNSQMHWVFINEKDEFGRIYNESIRLKKILGNLTDIVIEKLEIMKRTKTKTSIDIHFRNLIHMAQLDIYARITALVSSIEKKIKPNHDREALYHQLPEVLIVSNKLNEFLWPYLEKETEKMFLEMKRIGVIKGTSYYDIVMSIPSILRGN